MLNPDSMSSQLSDHLGVAEAMTGLLPGVRATGDAIIRALEFGGVLYTFGNGGSAADAQHLTGEIIGHYKRDRRPLAAVTLSTDPTTMTCIGNDYGYDEVFSRQVLALARPGDVVAGFTTSGNSANVVLALQTARQRNATTVLFTGSGGGAALRHADYALIVPSAVTARIQEMHTFMLHVIAEMVDEWAADEPSLSEASARPR